MRVASGLLFAGSYKSVKVWNLESVSEVTTLDAHNHWVRALNITKGHLYSGGYNAVNVRIHRQNLFPFFESLFLLELKFSYLVYYKINY